MDEITEITQLVLKERQGRDRGWWERMRPCYADDAAIRLSWFRGGGAEFIAESQKMAARGDTARHRLSPPVVHQQDGRAFVELPAVIEVRTVVDDVEVDLASAARLYFRVERRDGRWLIASLDPVYEQDTITPVHPGVSLRIAPADVAAYRPPYRFLSYVFSRRGYRIGDDLYGDDRPEETARFYADAFTWLSTGR
ncbi:nuclear transport factor 2 family protein [Pseudonocardia acaciae]|uniref:nuclear transport factor 2 family protein n=1 Tax=Pseudonocardia acaciae TaxID=551276 RepID=UPI00048EB94C|nr:nuclear transport factor 2 family protein [Pseudonocardia acaciae]